MFGLLFSMEGRISRSQYWLQWAVQTILGAGLFYAGITATEPSFAWPAMALEVAVLWMVLCRIGKRLHDRGKSAWYVLGWFVPVIGMTWEFIACGFMPGDPGDNAYGPAPQPRDGPERSSEGGQLARLDDEYFRKMAEGLRNEQQTMQPGAAPASVAPVAGQVFGKRSN